jgi:predicted Zn-dependent peptidase
LNFIQPLKLSFNYFVLTLSSSQSNEFFIKFKSVDSFVEALKAVEPAQMQKIAKKLLKTPPTLVSYGDLNNVPDTFELKL